MTKRLAAKTGEYQKDGQTKGEYVDIGVIIPGTDGEYLLLDPTVSLAGIMAKQNAFAMQQNKPIRTSVMVSVFDSNNQQQAQQGGYQHPPQQQGYAPQQQPPQQGGYQQPQGGYQQPR